MRTIFLLVATLLAAFSLTCCASAQIVGDAQKTELWRIDVARTREQKDTIDDLLQQLGPQIAAGGKTILEAVRVHRADPTEANWDAMMSVAVQAVTELSDRVRAIEESYSLLNREMGRAIERAGQDLNGSERASVQLGKELEVIDGDTEELGRTNLGIRKRKAEAMQGGPPLSMEEELQFDEVAARFLELKRSRNRQEQRIRNNAADRRMIERVSRSLLEQRRNLRSQAYRNGVFADELGGVAERMDVWLRRRDYLALCQGVLDIGKAADGLDANWHTISVAFDEMGLSMDEKEGAEGVAKQPLSVDLEHWIMDAMPKPEEGK